MKPTTNLYTNVEQIVVKCPPVGPGVMVFDYDNVAGRAAIKLDHVRMIELNEDFTSFGAGEGHGYVMFLDMGDNLAIRLHIQAEADEHDAVVNVFNALAAL